MVHISVYKCRHVFAGLVTTLAGSAFPAYADGMGSAASFSVPSEVAVDCSGAWVTFAINMTVLLTTGWIDMTELCEFMGVLL